MFLKRKFKIKSNSLKREVVLDLAYPTGMMANKKLPLMLMNDGQDFDQLGMDTLLSGYWKKGGQPFIFVGIHANKNRLSEYGTSKVLDYKGRGKLANAYQEFVENELIRELHSSLPVSDKNHVLCGFSLGGLSAFDMVWRKPDLFSKVGVFSGALWWRSKDYGEDYSDENDRIIHQKVKNGKYAPNLKFWLQCGTKDEKADRNNNGVIDSIDDTLDLIEVLKAKNYTLGNDISYIEVVNGGHNFKTWKKVMPDFLAWAFG